MFKLQLLGGCALRCDGEPLTGPAVQPRRLALFALIACSRQNGLSRDKLIACFWPEEDREHARHFLADSLFTIRRSLGHEVISTSGSDIRLNPNEISADVWMFEDACARNDCELAAHLYRGPFLDGFFIDDAPEFERWAESERERCRLMYASCLERRAEEFENAGDMKAALERWMRLSKVDPYSSRVAVRTMLAFEKTGDAVAAVQHAARYEKLVRDDLELEPDDAVLLLTERLRSRKPATTTRAHEPVLSVPGPSTIIEETLTTAASNATPPQGAAVSQRVSWRHTIIVTSLIAIMTSLTVGVRAYRNSNGETASVTLDEKPTASISSSAAHTSRTPRQEAEELYHEGRLTMMSAPMSVRFNDAMTLFRKALDADPTYALPYTGIANAYSYKGDYEHAKEAALKALAIDSTLDEAQSALAYVLGYYEHHWHAADSALVRAITSSPRNAGAHLRRAYIQAVLGQTDSALASAQRAQSIEPESWIGLVNRAMIESAVGKSSDAIRHFEAALFMEPNRPDVKLHLAQEYAAVGRTQAATAMLKSMGEASELTVIATGDKAEMETLLKNYEKKSVKIDPSHAAMLYMQLGKNDPAFRLLREALWSDRYLALHLRHRPLLGLRRDPRYTKLLKDLGIFNDADAIPRPN